METTYTHTHSHTHTHTNFSVKNLLLTSLRLIQRLGAAAHIAFGAHLRVINLLIDDLYMYI